jgi:hypothetical protein
MNIILFGVFDDASNRVVIFRDCNQKDVGGFDFIFELLDPLGGLASNYWLKGCIPTERKTSIATYCDATSTTAWTNALFNEPLRMLPTKARTLIISDIRKLKDNLD